jgi:hypothetical protein
VANIKEIALIDPTDCNSDLLIEGLRSEVVAVRLEAASRTMIQIACAPHGHTGESWGLDLGSAVVRASAPLTALSIASCGDALAPNAEARRSPPGAPK